MESLKKQNDTSALHPNQLVTGQDLENFRQKMVSDLEQLLKQHLGSTPRRWLKSYEVRKLLNISPGTLQQLKAKGAIPYSKMGGVHYHDWEAIEELLQSGKKAV
ncbi:MAG: helix-turn-helix domain-containing protein [Bacteroidetes bacterium]|nr:helix-turn-helix domain-containing protein [Bacteroidota bacterium]